MKNDQYLRLVDLRHNQFTKELLEEFVEQYLKHNRSLFAIDMRHNPGFSENIMKRSALVMLKNIESAYKNRETVKPQWIIKPLIFINIPMEKQSKDCIS